MLIFKIYENPAKRLFFNSLSFSTFHSSTKSSEVLNFQNLLNTIPSHFLGQQDETSLCTLRIVLSVSTLSQNYVSQKLFNSVMDIWHNKLCSSIWFKVFICYWVGMNVHTSDPYFFLRSVFLIDWKFFQLVQSFKSINNSKIKNLQQWILFYLLCLNTFQPSFYIYQFPVV